VYRESPIAPHDGHIVATTIADFGVDLNPPASYLVDQGKHLVNFLPNMDVLDAYNKIHPPIKSKAAKLQGYKGVVKWTDDTLCHQRHSRVGRNSNGIVFAPALAGSGIKYSTLQNVTSFLHFPFFLFKEVVYDIDPEFPIALNENEPFYGLIRIENNRFSKLQINTKIIMHTMAYIMLAWRLGSFLKAEQQIASCFYDDYFSLLELIGLEPEPLDSDFMDGKYTRCIYSTYTKEPKGPRSAPLLLWDVTSDSFVVL